MTAILPGSTIGVLGSGQLGRMFAIAARRMGYRVHTLSPETDTPTGQVADVEITAEYDDLDAIRKLANSVDVLTFEFENVPAATAAAAAELRPVRPSGAILEITQNRLREKAFLQAKGFPVTPFVHIRDIEHLRDGIREFGEGVLKSCNWGYDGKGQIGIDSSSIVEDIWARLGATDAVLEKFVPFDNEISIIVSRGLNGAMNNFEVTRNHHTDKILDYSVTPAPVSETVRARAIEIALATAEELGLVGVLCIEMFVTSFDDILVNELAPRPHNSGHWTFDACVTSQFEQQLRAVCGLPLGSTAQLRPAAMGNLLGDLWAHGEPRWDAALRVPDVKLHLYGKATPRQGRKMGHLTAMADDADRALSLVWQARDALRGE